MNEVKDTLQGVEFSEFMKWLLAMQAVDNYFPKIYSALKKHFNDTTISDYAALEEKIVAATMGNFKQQKAELKKLRDLKSSERIHVQRTNKNLADLRRITHDLTANLKHINGENNKIAYELLIQYMDTKIKL